MAPRLSAAWIASLLALALPTAGLALPITYFVNTTGIGSNGSVTGSIQTDGTIGTLSAGNIIGVNLTINANGDTGTITGTIMSGSVAAFPDPPSPYVGALLGLGLTATATDLLFNFGINSTLLFEHHSDHQTLWCLDGLSGTPGRCGFTQGREIAWANGTGSAQQSIRSGIHTILSVPEPSTAFLLATGVAGLAASGWRRRSVH